MQAPDLDVRSGVRQIAARAAIKQPIVAGLTSSYKPPILIGSS
jgi:hypothetical protein